MSYFLDFPNLAQEQRRKNNGMNTFVAVVVKIAILLTIVEIIRLIEQNV